MTDSASKDTPGHFQIQEVSDLHRQRKEKTLKMPGPQELALYTESDVTKTKDPMAAV